MGAFLDRVKIGMKNAQPPSDDDCAFDVRASVAKPGLVCTPGCAFRFKVRALLRWFVLGCVWIVSMD